MLGGMLLSLHNIYFYQNMMKEIREAIETSSFENYSTKFLSMYKN